jgi:hypothetical protein
VVERSQQQHGVDRGVGEVELAGVADRRPDLGQASGGAAELIDVERHQITVLDPVATSGQPQRIPARATADVGDHRGGVGKVPEQDLLGPLELHHAVALAEAVLFATQRVVGVHRGVGGVVHGGASVADGGGRASTPWLSAGRRGR